MVSQNKRFSFKIKRQAKNVFPKDVERTVVTEKNWCGKWNMSIAAENAEKR